MEIVSGLTQENTNTNMSKGLKAKNKTHHISETKTSQLITVGAFIPIVFSLQSHI